MRVPWPCALALGCALDDVPADGTTPADASSSCATDGCSTSTSSGSTTSDGSTTTAADSSSEGSSSTGDPPPSLPGCPRERSEVDRPDDSRLPQVRALYVIPADLDDDGFDTDDRICHSVQGWTQWLQAETDGRALRLDTEAGVLDVGFVRLELDDATMHGTTETADVDTGVAYVRDRIERELLLGGHIVPHKLYAVYYGGTSEYACGGGAYPPFIVDQVGAMYLGGEIPGFLPCDAEPWGEPDLVPRYVDYGMLHELVHSLGAVDLLAPNQHASGHAYDARAATPERDLMYSPREDRADPSWDTPAGLILDLDRNDYFDHGDPDMVDVARSAFLEPLPPDAELPPAW